MNSYYVPGIRDWSVHSTKSLLSRGTWIKGKTDMNKELACNMVHTTIVCYQNTEEDKPLSVQGHHRGSGTPRNLQKYKGVQKMDREGRLGGSVG